MARQFNTIMEELEALKKVVNRQEFPCLPEHSEQGGASSGPSVTPRLEVSRTLSGRPSK